MSGDAVQSSQVKYLEAWNPNEGLDEFKYSKEGLFHDQGDAMSTPPERFPATQIDDLVFGIKAKDHHTAFIAAPQ